MLINDLIVEMDADLSTVPPHEIRNGDDDDSDDEPFVYPDDTAADTVNGAEEEESDDEPFVYPDTDGDAVTNTTAATEQSKPTNGTSPSPPSGSDSHSAAAVHTSASSQSQSQPSPAQLESLYAAASAGDLRLLKSIFQKASENGNVEAFSLANDASSRTGLTALHAAASRGYMDIVKWRESLVLLILAQYSRLC